MTGLKAKTRLPPTPPVQHSTLLCAKSKSSSPSCASRSMSEAERVINIAVKPAASAAKTADISEMLHAGVGCP